MSRSLTRAKFAPCIGRGARAFELILESDVSETDVVLFALDDHIATPTLNRPDRRNALSVAAANRLYARSLAEQIRDNAPLSVLAAKESILATMNLGCERGLAEAKRIYTRVYASEDAQEGPRAFAEKRRPIWRGR